MTARPLPTWNLDSTHNEAAIRVNARATAGSISPGVLTRMSPDLIRSHDMIRMQRARNLILNRPQRPAQQAPSSATQAYHEKAVVIS